MGILALTAVAGTAVSAMPAASAGRAAWLLGSMGVGFVLAKVSAAWPDRMERIAVAVVLGLGVAVAVIGLLGTDWAAAPVWAVPWLGEVYRRLPTTLGALPGQRLAQATDLANPREVGGTLALLFPLAAVLLWSRRGSPGRCWAAQAGATLVMGVTLLLSQSVSAIAG
ncbi:MAG: hypothetical protein ACRDI2_24905, partial [Chloroflexota bacterium]